MNTQSNLGNSEQVAETQSFALLTRDQSKVMAALMVIGTGAFFALANAGMVSWSGSWWVMYIVIPGVMLLYSAGAALVQSRHASSPVIRNAVLGALGILLSIILWVDPTWSFTHGWRLDQYFPFLRNVSWDPIWQAALVILGAVSVSIAILRRAVGLGVFGALLILVGGTLFLHLSWDSIWPLMIIVVGAGLLVPLLRKK